MAVAGWMQSFPPLRNTQRHTKSAGLPPGRRPPTTTKQGREQRGDGPQLTRNQPQRAERSIDHGQEEDERDEEEAGSQEE